MGLKDTVKKKGTSKIFGTSVYQFFDLEIEGVTIATFVGCEGFGSEIEIEEKYNVGSFKPRIYTGNIKFNHIILKNGITRDDGLFDWYMKIVNALKNGKVRSVPDMHRHNIKITAQSNYGQAVKTWTLIKAFPCKWVGPPFGLGASGLINGDSHATNETTIERLELVYEDIQEKLSSKMEMLKTGAGTNAARAVPKVAALAVKAVSPSDSASDASPPANKKCAKCGVKIDASSKFCTACGKAQEKTCEKCGASMAITDTFCKSCSNKVADKQKKCTKCSAPMSQDASICPTCAAKQ
jgi:phage tail-like protein